MLKGGSRADSIDGRSPQGVAMGMKRPVWLKDGDLVEVALEGVGSCANKVVFEKREKAKI